VRIEDVSVDNKLIYVEDPGVGVLCDPEEEVVSDLRVLPTIAVDDCILGVDVFVDGGTASVVPAKEDIATDSDEVAIEVTVVLLGIPEYDELVCGNVVISPEPV